MHRTLLELKSSKRLLIFHRSLGCQCCIFELSSGNSQHHLNQIPANSLSTAKIIFVFLFLGIICLACGSPALLAATSFFLFVVVVAFIATLLWIFAYLLGIREALNLAVNWIFTF
uniref:MARVEL domain-containing protein n=1 Tax=Glossina palpalis gambiensis TaxID=67801 RepID=A0A1B0AXR6_9MUSC